MFFFKNDDGEEMITLTYMDEVNLSKVVMDCIALRWVQGEFQHLLDRIYYIKCAHGSALKWVELDRLLYFIGERYGEELESLGIVCPEIEDNELAIWSDLDPKQYPTSQDRNAETRRMVIDAWRTTWNKHAGHKMAADSYKTFPGDQWRDNPNLDHETMDKAQEELETAFWAEVNKTAEMYAEDEYDVPYYLIIRQVEDYMPRKVSDIDLE